VSRPPETWCSEASACAACTGRRNAGSSVAVPSVTRSVTAAAAASTVSGSRIGRSSVSPAQTEAKPSSSARCAKAISARGSASPPHRPMPVGRTTPKSRAAGFTPAYAETPLDGRTLAPVRAALRHVLDGHLPYPAIVVDRHGDLIAANRGFDLFTEGVPAGLLAPPVNVYRLALHPDGMAARIVNLAEWAHHILDRLTQESRRNPDARLTALLAELGRPDRAAGPDYVGFAVPMRLGTSRAICA
jgi:hypothetical protein